MDRRPFGPFQSLASVGKKTQGRIVGRGGQTGAVLDSHQYGFAKVYPSSDAVTMRANKPYPKIWEKNHPHAVEPNPRRFAGNCRRNVNPSGCKDNFSSIATATDHKSEEFSHNLGWPKLAAGGWRPVVCLSSSIRPAGWAVIGFMEYHAWLGEQA